MKILALFFLFSNYYQPHPIHLTVTNIEYNSNKKEFELIIKLFSDDFESVINSKYNVILNLGQENELKKADEFITNYIFENIVLNLNGKIIDSKNFILKKREQKDISIWLTYTVKYKEKVDNCQITNTLLFDKYDDQKNMLIFTYNDIQNALEFYIDKKTQTINF